MTVVNMYAYVHSNRHDIQKKLRINDDLESSNHNTLESEAEQAQIDENIEERLIKIKNNPFYKNEIKELAVYPFCISICMSIYHWTQEALDFANLFTRKLYFLVNGNLCQNFFAPDGSSSNKIYLTSLGVVDKITSNFLPISQLSSDDQSLSDVNRFFFECLRNGLKIPGSIKLDFMVNFYKAANEAFNINVSYETYLSNCFDHLIGKKLAPRCTITTDIRFMCIKVFK